MDMDQAAVFLAGSVLTMMGIIVLIIGIVIINNIIHKYWKPLGWTLWPAYLNPAAPRFASQEELDRIAPHLDEPTHKK